MEAIKKVWELVCKGFNYILDYPERYEKNVDAYQEQKKSEAIRFQCAVRERDVYPVLAQCVGNCLRDNGTRCGLERPARLEQFFTPENRRVGYSENLGYYYCFLVRRASVSCIKDGSLQTEYADMSAQNIREQLDEVMGTYTRQQGFPYVSVFNVRNCTNSRVLVAITWGEKYGEI